MKSIIKNKETLKTINVLTFILVILNGLIFSFGHRIIGTILIIITLIVGWRLYRCPNCNKALDPRINIDKNPYCPHCGKEI